MNETRLLIDTHAFLWFINDSPNLSPKAADLLESDVEVLPITLARPAIVASLPLHHRDPFDRLLIAQAMAEEIAIVSVDAKFDGYGIERRW